MSGLSIPRSPQADRRVRAAIDRLRSENFLTDGESITTVNGVLVIRTDPPIRRTATGVGLHIAAGLEVVAGNLAIQNLTGASKGDILVFDGTQLQRLPAPADNGLVLTSDSLSPTGLAWTEGGTLVRQLAATGGLVSSGTASITVTGASAFSSAFSSAFGA